MQQPFKKSIEAFNFLNLFYFTWTAKNTVIAERASTLKLVWYVTIYSLFLPYVFFVVSWCVPFCSDLEHHEMENGKLMFWARPCVLPRAGNSVIRNKLIIRIWREFPGYIIMYICLTEDFSKTILVS